MEFLNIYAFLLLLIVPIVMYIKSKAIPFSKEIADKLILKSRISKKTKFYLLIMAYVLFVTALSRPIINNGIITIKAPIENVVIGLDISHEMDKTDLYPNRFEFAKNKIKKLLNNLNAQNVALILFDKNSYLISPPTTDYKSLEYLLEHTDIKNIKRSSLPDIENFIASAKNLVKNPKTVIFTGYIYTPKNKNIYVYLCNQNKIDSKNVFNASYTNDNIKKLAELLKSNKSKEIKIKNKTELFYYPLSLGILVLLFVIFFPVRRIK